MVRLALFIKAELHNVTDLVPASDNFDYFFKVKCTSCNEEHPKFVSMNRAESFEMSGGKNASANFVWRCGSCKRQHSASFEPAVPPRPYSAESNGQFARLVELDCRGLEFVGFDPRGIWTCKGAESGTVFSEVDLSEGEWSDYDEKASEDVSVMNIESEWKRA